MRANVALRSRGSAARTVRIIVSTPRSNVLEPVVLGEVVEAADVRGPAALMRPLSSPHRSSRNVNAASTSPVSSRSHLQADGVRRTRGDELVLGLAQVASVRAEHRDPAALGRRGVRPRHGPCREPPAMQIARPRSPEVHGQAASSRGEMRGGERLTGGPFDEAVPPQRRPRPEDLVDQEPAGGGLVDHPPARARVERRLELRGGELPVEVVLVVDGRHGEVDLRRPVRRAAPVGPAHPLELLDQVPPAGVVVGVGIGVEAALECSSSTSTQRANTSRPAAVPRPSAGAKGGDPAGADPGDVGQPAGMRRVARTAWRRPRSVSAWAAARSSQGSDGRARGRTRRDRTRGASSRSTARWARCCTARARHPRGRCGCRTRAGSSLRA